MTMDDFEELVADAIDALPVQFLDELDNINFFIEEEPPAGEHPDTLGLYDGIPLTERSEYLDGELPDSITVFKGPHERQFSDSDRLAEEVYRTVVHEVGHYFGMDEDQIEEMGYA